LLFNQLYKTTCWRDDGDESTKEVTTMIKLIKEVLGLETHKKQAVNCNYANNYYGDQLCSKNSETS